MKFEDDVFLFDFFDLFIVKVSHKNEKKIER
jgi:hypothetical protein